MRRDGRMIGYRQRKATVRLKESVLAHCSSTY